MAEIMSPVGNFESLQAAIQNGADSVYFGIKGLNMRSMAANNFTIEDLPEIVEICSKKGVKTYLTVNTIMYDSDLDLMRKIIDSAKENKLSAIISCDIAAISYANEVGVPVHISVQANVSNTEAVKFYSKFSDTMVLSRELTLEQVRNIINEIKKQDIRGPRGNLVNIEVFAHGALCVSVSGKCYMSLALYNKSANRGECIQPCRRKYNVRDDETGEELVIDNNYVMSPKDLCTIQFIDKILDAGVSVLKLEGRGRAPDYVATVTKCYREAVDSYEDGTFTKEKAETWVKELESVYNRGFWHGGNYLGKKLGEWAGVYGSKATKDKILVGKVNNYYQKPKVALIEIESGEITVGDEIMFTGPTTGVLKSKLIQINLDDKIVKRAVKGNLITIPFETVLRKNDKFYILKDKSQEKE